MDPFAAIINGAGAAVSEALEAGYPGFWHKTYTGQENKTMLHETQMRRAPGVFTRLANTQAVDDEDIDRDLRPRMCYLHFLEVAGTIQNRSSIETVQAMAWAMEEKIENDPAFCFGLDWIQPGTLRVVETQIEDQSTSGTIYSVVIEFIAYFGLYQPQGE